MSIVAVHGPYTFGSKAVVEAGAVMATVNPTNGLIWTFNLDSSTTRVAADFDWTYTPAGGSPATPIADDLPPLTITFSTAGAKTVTLTVSGAGAGANPYPPAGTYPITVNAVSGAAPQSMLMGAPEETPPEESLEPQEAATPPEETEAYYDPSAHTVDEVIAYAESHPDEVDEIYEAETEGKNRSTLVAHLESLMPYDPSDYTVGDVVAYAEANPDQLEDIIAAEQAGKNRSTLIAQLENMRTA